ncbi:MAG: M24 family metallopeptidase [Parvularcula sp.]
MITRRTLFQGVAGVTLLSSLSPANALIGAATPMPRLIDKAVPITRKERAARISKAQALMRNRKIGGLLLEPGATMEYFTGLKWWRSERLTGVIIPADGEVGVVTPSFEEPSVRESLDFDPVVRTWDEHENPFARVASFLTDTQSKGPLAIEDSVRFFVTDGLRKEMARDIVSGRPIVNGCRMLKSPAELALMQTANDITMAAYRKTYAAIEKGMSPTDITDIMAAATIEEGGTPVFTMALIDEASSFPHGSHQPQTVKDQSIVLMDCGCDVHGYKSDISRTFFAGEPTAKQSRIWNVVKAGQQLALDSAKPGVPAGHIDDVVRQFYEKEGFGPGYKTPGLTHRLGHGIGMEVHEPINFVHGEITPLAPGMCLSNEPGIYLPGEFGVRLEDCITITENGAKPFSGLSPSIEDPIG